MDWISLAIAIALLVVAVYTGISYYKEKKQSAVYLGDSALFTIIPSYAHRENGLRAFLVVNGQKVVASTPKTARNAPDLFYAYAWLCTPPHSR
ncbi:small membrane protein [Klebsiella pneumoniae]|uniref:small membrane protein n=1 Tax=Klebsiella pneumoniae TaxID=573 RepID=UPI00235FD820|nr:small membrane protein [Klebsiella pneumoniae]MDD1395064.1 small membrane protein [Klebsiella pneumoniae]